MKSNNETNIAILKFGKYKGTNINKLKDNAYKLWLIENYYQDNNSYYTYVIETFKKQLKII